MKLPLMMTFFMIRKGDILSLVSYFKISSFMIFQCSSKTKTNFQSFYVYVSSISQIHYIKSQQRLKMSCPCTITSIIMEKIHHVNDHLNT